MIRECSKLWKKEDFTFAFYSSVPVKKIYRAIEWMSRLNYRQWRGSKKINWIATWAFCGRFFSPPPNIIKLYRFFKIKSPARHNFSIFFHFPIIFQLEEAVGVKCQTWSIAKILKFCRHLQQGWKRFGLYSPDLQRWDFSNANAETIPRQAKSLFGYFIIW